MRPARSLRTTTSDGVGDGLPVILMSAMAEPADLDPEITAFLRKPLDLDRLLALIAQLLTSR